MPSSLDQNVADAVIEIAEMTTAEEIEAFIAGDTRKGVLNAADARMEELTAPTKPQEEPTPMREATVATGTVRRFHKTKPSKVFKKGETIPADWYESADGMCDQTEEENWR